MTSVTDSVTAKGTQMLSQTVAREVRAELGRQSISRKTFAEKACLPYKRALEMLDGQRPWGLEDVDTAASVLGVDALNLIFPDRVEASAA